MRRKEGRLQKSCFQKWLDLIHWYPAHLQTLLFSIHAPSLQFQEKSNILPCLWHFSCSVHLHESISSQFFQIWLDNSTHFKVLTYTHVPGKLYLGPKSIFLLLKFPKIPELPCHASNYLIMSCLRGCFWQQKAENIGCLHIWSTSTAVHLAHCRMGEWIYPQLSFSLWVIPWISWIEVYFF